MLLAWFLPSPFSIYMLHHVLSNLHWWIPHSQPKMHILALVLLQLRLRADLKSKSRHCRHFTMFCQKISENIKWKDTLFYKNKCWKTYYIFFPITFWAGQSASRKQHVLDENIQNVFRTCFGRKRVSLIWMFFEKTWWNASSEGGGSGRWRAVVVTVDADG